MFFYFCPEMKFLSILVLTIFLNFMALPSIATVFGWELPQTNVVLNEEETHSKTISVFEKAIPSTFDVNDFLTFCENDFQYHIFNIQDEAIHISPYISVFSPPPEV